MTVAGPQLFSANRDYADELLRAISAAHERILCETMDLDCFGAMADVLEACLAARLRGVDVTIVYDARNSYGSARRDYGAVGSKRLRDWLMQLKQAGVMLYEVGAHKVNPFAGRHHAKAVIVDNYAYIGGGVNLTGHSFKAYDFMLRYDSPKLAQILHDVLPRAALERTHDQVIYNDDMTEVLLDAGIKNQSLIYDRTCELAQKAVKAWYVSMLAPDGRLVRLLRQKDTQYWYNSLKSSISFSKLAVFIDQIKTKVSNGYQDKALLHAKFCVFQLSDGTYEAITGSHNFNSRGVAFGTQELAIHTKDQALCEQLIVFANNLSK